MILYLVGNSADDHKLAYRLQGKLVLQIILLMYTNYESKLLINYYQPTSNQLFVIGIIGWFEVINCWPGPGMN